MMRKRELSLQPRLEILEDRLCPSAYSVIDLAPVSGSTYSSANAVNDTGNLVAGDSSNDGFVGAAVWKINAANQATVVALPEIVARASSARDVNSVGQIVGFSDTTLTSPDPANPNTVHAVLWQTNSGGAYVVTDLGAPPGLPYSEANAINNAGQVVGFAVSSAALPNFQQAGFVWDSVNGMRDLNSLLPAASGWQITNAYDINDSGQIVGNGLHDGVQRGFRFDLSTATIVDIGVLEGGIRSVAYGLNSLGSVAGVSDTSTLNRHGQRISNGVLWQNNSLTNLGSLGDSGSNAFSVNDAGAVVGTYFKTTRDPLSKEFRAFIWAGGVMKDLNTLIPTKPRWVLTGADDINGSGRIVGTGVVRLGGVTQNHGYLLVPTSALLAQSTPSQTVMESLVTNQVSPILAEARARWQRSGVDVSSLAAIDLRITNLGGTTLGLASGNTIWLNDNAAGHGWFIDKTPRNDSEFSKPGDQGEKNRIDLLSVVMHEMGHVLGFDHEGDGVMDEALTTGKRRVPQSAAT